MGEKKIGLIHRNGKNSQCNYKKKLNNAVNFLTILFERDITFKQSSKLKCLKIFCNNTK